MKVREIAIWIGVLVVLVGGVWLLIAAVNNSPSPSAPLAIKIPEVSKDDYVKVLGSVKSASDSIETGSDSANTESDLAKVTLIEYGDFQCPACAAYFPFVKQLSSEFPKDLRIAHRFFPLTRIHKNALISAQAAYAAGMQGKFWEMHDKLYENQNSWSKTNPREIFINYAKDLKIDLDKFKIDLDADSTKEFIKNSENKALSLGINSTPTFFVNGKHIENPSGYEEFKKIIQNEINK